MATRSVPATWWADVRRVATLSAVLEYSGELTEAEVEKARLEARAGRRG